MCACDWNYVCTRCAGTPQDYRWWLDESPRELDEQRRDQEPAGETEEGITRGTR